MKALSKWSQIIAGALLAVFCGLLAYFPWVILESLGDFMSRPRRAANIVLLMAIFLPLVLVTGLCWWRVSKPKGFFFESLGLSALVVFLIMTAIHQSSVAAKWQQSPEGQVQVQVMKLVAARDRVMPEGKIGNLKPPLDQDEISVLASEVRWPNVDGATLHRVLAAVPKQLDCVIVQNPNILQQDLLAIWNEHDCPDLDIADNPQAPLDVLRKIFESHPEANRDEKTRTAQEHAAVRLAKQDCDPELLYSLFNSKGDLAVDSAAGWDMRVKMVSNVCTPAIVRKQMQELPDLNQPADYERAYPPMSREVWEAQHWSPSRETSTGKSFGKN